MKLIPRVAMILAVTLSLTLSVPLLTGAGPTAHAAVPAWQLSSAGGFGAGGDGLAAIPIAHFQGDIYAGVAGEGGAEVWVSDDAGATWNVSVADAFGDSGNLAVVRMEVYDGYLYAGTANMDGCQLWRFDGADWTDALAAGGVSASFGDATNLAVTAMEVFDGKLYMGLTNYEVNISDILHPIIRTNGVNVWRYDGFTWDQVDEGAFDATTNNAGIGSFAVYGGNLYATTIRFDVGIEYPLPPFDLTRARIEVKGKGCQLWRTDGTGDPLTWNMAADNGFGDAENLASLAMCEYGGNLYISAVNGTASVVVNINTMEVESYDFSTDGLSIYRYGGSGVPTAVVTGGFGTADDVAVACMETMITSDGLRLLAGTASTSGAGKLMFYDGTDWEAGAPGGFGNPDNLALTALAVVDEGGDDVAYVGTANDGDGCEVWKGTPGSYHTITASAGTGGSIAPAGGIVLAEGSGQAFTITPSAGWHVADVKVDGASKGAVGVYTFTNVTADHTIAATFAQDVSPLATWYLAEGCTDHGFGCYISIANPNEQAVNVRLTYMLGSGPVAGPTVAMPARSQATVEPAATLGPADFSTRVDCLENKSIAVDRTMYWAGTYASCSEAHCASGVTAPARTWYMPEGSSAHGFECFLLIQNPNGAVATCTVTWMIEGSGPATNVFSVPANSRATYNMADWIGAADASIKVEANAPVICERAMYRYDRREGHDSTGTTVSAPDYYLAEGCTGYGFTTFILVQNPQGTPTDVAITYQAASGPVAGPSFQMPANSRKTVNVNATTEIPGPDPSFSTHVHGSAPIIAERAMYWDYGQGEACHDSIGLDAPHTSWYLADGQTDAGRETFTLVQNPNDIDVTVEVTYMTPTGAGNVTRTETVGANSRRTFNMADHSGIYGRAAVMVRCTTAGSKVMVERAMYWNERGTGTDTIGGYSD